MLSILLRPARGRQSPSTGMTGTTAGGVTIVGDRTAAGVAAGAGIIAGRATTAGVRMVNGAAGSGIIAGGAITAGAQIANGSADRWQSHCRRPATYGGGCKGRFLMLLLGAGFLACQPQRSWIARKSHCSPALSKHGALRLPRFHPGKATNVTY